MDPDTELECLDGVVLKCRAGAAAGRLAEKQPEMAGSRWICAGHQHLFSDAQYAVPGADGGGVLENTIG